MRTPKAGAMSSEASIDALPNEVRGKGSAIAHKGKADCAMRVLKTPSPLRQWLRADNPPFLRLSATAERVSKSYGSKFGIAKSLRRNIRRFFDKLRMTILFVIPTVAEGSPRI